MSLNEPIDQDDQSDYNRNIRSTERERDPAALHPHVHDQRGDTTNIDVEMGNIADDIVTIMDLHESSESSPDLQNESSPDLNTIHPRQTRRTGNDIHFSNRSSPIASSSESDNDSQSNARDRNRTLTFYLRMHSTYMKQYLIGRGRYRGRHRRYKSLRRKQGDSDSDNTKDKKKPARRSYRFQKKPKRNLVPSHGYALRSISGQSNVRQPTLEPNQFIESNLRNRNKPSVNNKSDGSREQSEELKSGGSRSVSRSVSCSDKENDENPTASTLLFLTMFMTAMTYPHCVYLFVCLCSF
eukprot:446425_1